MDLMISRIKFFKVVLSTYNLSGPDRATWLGPDHNVTQGQIGSQLEMKCRVWLGPTLGHDIGFVFYFEILKNAFRCWFENEKMSV